MTMLGARNQYGISALLHDGDDSPHA